MARITLENVSKTFGRVKALDGVSLDVKDKEFFVLFGPAGAGKTTILNCIAGIAMPEDISPLAVYLASDESSFVNGASHVIDSDVCLSR